MSCERNTRPHLPPWAQNITLDDGSPNNDVEDSVSGRQDYVPEGYGTGAEDEDVQTNDRHEVAANIDVDTNGDKDSSPVPGISMTQVREVFGYIKLGPSSMVVDTQNLEDWLFERLISGMDGEGAPGVLTAWCRYWEWRIRKVGSVLEQVINRKLFIQSLRRLHSLSSTSLPSIDIAFIVADIENEEWRKLQRADHSAAVQVLQEFPEYAAFKGVSDQLVRYINARPSQAASLHMKSLSEMQILYFQAVTLGPHFEHWKDHIRLAIIWTCGILRDLEPETDPAPAESSDGTIRRPGLWHENGDVLLEDKTTAFLKLKTWQLRARLCLVADCGQIVRRCQKFYFERVLVGGHFAPVSTVMCTGRAQGCSYFAEQDCTAPVIHR